MIAVVEVIEYEGRVGLKFHFPEELIAFIADGGDMEGKRGLIQMDREQALVVADELREKALAL